MTIGVKKPCNDCPFTRGVEPGALGGGPVDRFIGQAYGPFRLPCHKHYTEATRLDPTNPQCAGAAKFRANIGVAPSLPDDLYKLPRDHGTVFVTAAEFIGHHLCVCMDEAKFILTQRTIPDMLRAEMRRAKRELP